MIDDLTARESPADRSGALGRYLPREQFLQVSKSALDFDLVGVHDFEVRAWVPSGAQLTIRGYTIESRAGNA